MKILFLGNPASPLIQHLCSELKKTNDSIKIDIIAIPYRFNSKISSESFDEIFNLGNNFISLEKIPYLKNIYFISNLRDLINQLPKYDVVSIQFVYYFYSLIIKEIKNKGKKFTITFWGSDFNKVNFWQKAQLKKIVNNADLVTTANSTFSQKIIDRFGTAKSKFRIARFGLAPLNSLRVLRKNMSGNEAKAKLGIFNKFVITIGYNANKIQQHFRIINELKQVLEKLPSNYLLVFPMTYGFGNRKKYTEKLRDELNKYNFNFIILDSFLSNNEVAYLRLATDVMIQLQTHDQFSGSMQEHLYSENIVITGSWLPYQAFKDVGTNFLEINNFSELKSKLPKTIDNFELEKEKCKLNPNKIWELSSWEKTISNWISIFGDNS
ncbi:MAG: hypothetical protein L3J41_07925 [Melioribacteraceae bacterium]|nr:hypothetical protein [Melioribacteraceae bacterium]